MLLKIHSFAMTQKYFRKNFFFPENLYSSLSVVIGGICKASTRHKNQEDMLQKVSSLSLVQGLLSRGSRITVSGVFSWGCPVNK